MITVIEGDATKPIKTPALIVNLNNDIGAWGRGFTESLDRLSKIPETQYRQWYSDHIRKKPSLFGNFSLGNIQIVPFKANNSGSTLVANMIAQKGVGTGVDRVDYSALDLCLSKVKDFMVKHPDYTLHMPELGCGLAGSRWNKIEPFIKEHLGKYEVYVYKYKK